MRTFVTLAALLFLPIGLILPNAVFGGEPQSSNRACCDEQQPDCQAAAEQAAAEVPACEMCDGGCPLHKLGKLDTSVHHLKHAHARQIAAVVKATIFQCLAKKLAGEAQPQSVSVVLIPTSSDDAIVAICPREHASLVKESIEACDVARHYVVKAQVFEVAGNGETVPVGRSSLIVGREGSVQCVSSAGETVTLSLKVGETAVSAAGAEAACPSQCASENVSVSQRDFDAERWTPEICQTSKDYVDADSNLNVSTSANETPVAAPSDVECSQCGRCSGTQCDFKNDPSGASVNAEEASVRRQQEFAELVEQYNKFMRQERWADAEQIGTQAKKLDPCNPVAFVMCEKARICHIAAQYENSQDYARCKEYLREPFDAAACTVSSDDTADGSIDKVGGAIEEKSQERIHRQQEFAGLVEEYNKLVKQDRWAEAELIAKQVKELDRCNIVAVMMYEKARIGREIARKEQLKSCNGDCPSCSRLWESNENLTNFGQGAPSQAAGASAASEESGTGTSAGHSESEDSSSNVASAPKCDSQEISSTAPESLPVPQCEVQTSLGAPAPTMACDGLQSCPCHGGAGGLKIVLSADGISFGPHAAAPWVTVQIPGLAHLLASHQEAAAASGSCHSAESNEACDGPATEISKLECTAPGHTVINDNELEAKTEPAPRCAINTSVSSGGPLWIVPILPANTLGAACQSDGSTIQPGIDVSPRPVNDVFAPHDISSSVLGRLILEVPKPAACGDSVPSHASGLIVVDGPDRVRIFERAPAAECETLPSAPAACPTCKDEFGTFLEELLRSSDPADITQVGKVDVESAGSDSVRELPSVSPAKIETTVVTYPLSDLVLLDEDGHPVFDTCTFIDHLQSAVAPDTWSHPSVSIQLNEQSLSLVVRQTPEVHKQIESHLHYLRRLQVKQLCHLLERMSSELHSAPN